MGTRRALVVANDEYEDNGLQSLRSPATDATALADVLGDPDIGQFELSVVRNATVQELREQLDTFFGSAGRADELLVHFSCHGLKDDSNDLYLAACDTRLGLLASTGLAADFVARRMRASRARSVALLLDCCYGGAFERGMLARASGEVSVLDSFEPGQLADGHGRVVITASSAVEYAFEGDDLTDDGGTQPSVFTAAVVKGIATGEADTAGTGRINIHELFAYAEDQVRRTNPRQTPHLWSFGTRGDILVARTPLRRVTPAALPVPVQTALAGDRISRLGAVHELSLLLDRDDPSLVLAAVQALGFLVDDDSRSLSEAAANALVQVDLTVTPSQVEVEPGDTAGVELGGSALAVAARVTSAPDWARVRQVGTRLLITADPSETSTAPITVEGPTGRADITLTATIPQAPEVPEGYETPEVPEVPEVPETSETSETPQTPETPETAKPARTAGTSRTARTAKTPQTEKTTPTAETAETAAPEAAEPPEAFEAEPTTAAEQGSKEGAETPKANKAAQVTRMTTVPNEGAGASTYETATPIWRQPTRMTRTLWAIAATITLLCLVLPMDSEGADLIWTGDYAGDMLGSNAAIWTILIFVTSGLLLAGTIRWFAGRIALTIGVLGTVVSVFVGIFAGFAAGTDGAAIPGTILAVFVAPILAVAGTVYAAVGFLQSNRLTR